MALVGSLIARAYLRNKTWPENDGRTPSAYLEKNKLEVLFGPSVWDEVSGKAILDFGCGDGKEAVEIARHAEPRRCIHNPGVIYQARSRPWSAGLRKLGEAVQKKYKIKV